MVFSGSSNISLSEKIARQLKLPLSPLEIHIFPDGERRVRVPESVVGKNTVVVQSLAKPVDQNYMEFFFIADALKRSGAENVTAVLPYLGYQRQDHVFRSGEAVSLDVIVKFLEKVGVNNIITFDLHSIKIPEFFHIPIKHLSALSLFAEKIREIGKVANLWDVILVSPDMGGIRRIKILAELLGNVAYCVIEKERDLESGEVRANKLVDLPDNTDLRGKTAVVVDDMISSGGTIAIASEFLEKRGVSEVYVFATHAVFSEDAPKVLSKPSIIKKVFVTDTVCVPKEKQFEKLEILSVSKMIADKLKE